MFTIVSLLFFLVLCMTVNSSFIDQGNGFCTSEKASNAGDIAPASVLYEYTILYDTMSESCKKICASIGDACIAVTVGFYTEFNETHHDCYLHGMNDQADFTNDPSIPSGEHPSYDASLGDANSGIIVSESEYTLTYYNYADTNCFAKPSAVAAGDPHITSVYGCKVDTPVLQLKDEESSVLMDCGDESIHINYKKSWTNHITSVDVKRHGNVTKYRFGALKHAHRTKVCGNTVEFHRYSLGISVHLRFATNTNFTGLFSDSSCL